MKQRTLADAGRRPRVPASAYRLAGFGVSKAVGGFPALPSVGAELDRIVRLGPDDRDGVMPGVLLMDDAFTESSLRDMLAKDFRWSTSRATSYFARARSATLSIARQRRSADARASARWRAVAGQRPDSHPIGVLHRDGRVRWQRR